MSITQLVVQPSQVVFPVPASANVFQRAIPAPGAPSAGIPAVAGVADCGNLITLSPPTLLEAYEIFGLVIGWGVVFDVGSIPAPTTCTAELALLVNDSPAFTLLAEGREVSVAPPAFAQLASGAWTADLVNPIVIGARDRLGLRVGLTTDQDRAGAGNNGTFFVGVQIGQTAAGIFPVAYESTISYRVLDAPASRRL